MRNMATIAIINLKGGVGKSVTACNLACILSGIYARRVLVMDLDKQANTTKFFERVQSGHQKTIADVLTLDAKLNDVIVHTGWDDIDLAPSNMQLLLANQSVMFDLARRREDRIRRALYPYRSEYDYCILDCPPDIDMATINALVAADWVIIPVDCDEWALDGLDEIMTQIRDVKAEYNEGLEIMGTLATKYDRGRYSTKTINQLVGLDIPTFRAADGSVLHIDSSVRVKESKAFHRPLYQYAPKCKPAAQYRTLAERVMEIAEGRENG